MLDQNDLVLMQGIIEKTVKAVLQQNNVDLRRDIRDEVHSLIAASEHRMTRRFDAKFDALEGRIDSLKGEIVDEITRFLNDAILPQFDDVHREIGYIKAHLKLA